MHISAALLLLGAVACCWGAARGEKLHFGRFKQQLQPPQSLKDARIPIKNWITQKLDHFNPTEVGTWEQKYYSNEQYYAPGGPVFLMIGGEGPASPAWLTGGHMMEMAQDFNASAFYLEHRFYGESMPQPDTTVSSLQYLTTEQALADTSFLIRHLRATSHPTGKLIVFGGSYAGNLAAWAELRYPHLIDGSVASSAPVLALVDYPEYYEVVATAMFNSSADCLSDIKTASDAVTAILSQPDGAQTITDMFKLCSLMDPNNYMDVSNFYSSFASIYAGAVQYADSVAEVGQWCSLMTDEVNGATPLDRYVKLAMDYLVFDGCFEHRHSAYIDYFGNTTWESDASQTGYRQWLYQTCTEYGYYQTSTSPIQPFGDFFKVDYYLQYCPDFYDAAFTPEFVYSAVDNTNLFYGGIGSEIDNVVYVHGSIDPWHVLGVLDDISATDSVDVVMIEGSAHCADMSTSSVSDSPELTQARVEIRQIVAGWLAA